MEYTQIKVIGQQLHTGMCMYLTNIMLIERNKIQKLHNYDSIYVKFKMGKVKLYCL